jgi:hypothetical protein
MKKDKKTNNDLQNILNKNCTLAIEAITVVCYSRTVRVSWVFSVMFCRSLFVFLSFFIWSIVFLLKNVLINIKRWKYIRRARNIMTKLKKDKMLSLQSHTEKAKYWTTWTPLKAEVKLRIYFHLFMLIKTFFNRQSTRPSFIYKSYRL